MTLKEIKAKLKEAGVDDGVITAVTALDNSAEVSRLESELKAEQGKAKGILEDKKRYKEERDALKVSLDKIETEKLPDEEKHAKALKELQEKLEKAEQEREEDAKKFAETQREARISDLTGSVKWAASTPQSTAKLIIKKDTFLIRNLFPLCVKKIPIILSDSLTEKDSILKCKIICEGDAFNFEIKFRVRKPHESFCETFLSKIDSSVQYYAVLPPKNYNPDKKYALIFALHGAGVEARGLVNAYSQKDWAFIVAPTNRRRFGFDWEDWGRLDALEILNIVKKKYPIDTLRIYLTSK